MLKYEFFRLFSPTHSQRLEIGHSEHRFLETSLWTFQNVLVHSPNRSHTRGMMNGTKKNVCFGAKHDSNHSDVLPIALMSILNFDSTSPVSQLSEHTWVYMSISRQNSGVTAEESKNGVLTLKRDWIGHVHLPRALMALII